MKVLEPILINRSDVPKYLGISASTFERWVRPNLSEICLGRCVLFSKVDIHNWIDNTKKRYKCPDLSTHGDEIWVKQRPSEAFTNVMVSGISTNKLADDAFAEALERIEKEKQKST